MTLHVALQANRGLIFSCVLPALASELLVVAGHVSPLCCSPTLRAEAFKLPFVGLSYLRLFAVLRGLLLRHAAQTDAAGERQRNFSEMKSDWLMTAADATVSATSDEHPIFMARFLIIP